MRLSVLRSLVYLVIGLALLLAAGSLDPNRTSQARAGTACRAAIASVETWIRNNHVCGGIHDPR